ncbi:MAG: hypothetical protein U9N59_16570 [Campylobacterota bacterium]|nr:hypothetical protein [Campylobacterota bacterium]
MKEKDYKKILQYHGSSVGCSGIYKFELLEKNIIEKFDSEIKNAQGLMINFVVNSDESIFSVGNFLDKLKIDKKTKTKFNTETSNKIEVGFCEIFILITGLDETI